MTSSRTVLDAFTKLRKATVSFVISLTESTRGTTQKLPFRVNTLLS